MISGTEDVYSSNQYQPNYIEVFGEQQHTKSKSKQSQQRKSIVLIRKNSHSSISNGSVLKKNTEKQYVKSKPENGTHEIDHHNFYTESNNSQKYQKPVPKKQDAELPVYQEPHQIPFQNQMPHQPTAHFPQPISNKTSRQTNLDLLQSLQDIQKQLNFFRKELDRSVLEKAELKHSLNKKSEQVYIFVQEVSSLISDIFPGINRNKTLQSVSWHIQELKSSYMGFKQLLESNDQIIKSQHLCIDELKQQIKGLEFQTHKSDKIIFDLKKQVSQLKQQQNIPKTLLKLIHGEVQTEKTEYDQTTDNSRSHHNVRFYPMINCQVQTDEKRIGTAFTMQQIRSANLLERRPSSNHPTETQHIVRSRYRYNPSSSASSKSTEYKHRYRNIIKAENTSKPNDYSIIEERRNVKGQKPKNVKQHQKAKNPTQSGYLDHLFVQNHHEQTKNQDTSLESQYQGLQNSKDKGRPFYSSTNLQQRSQISLRKPPVPRARSRSQKDFSIEHSSQRDQKSIKSQSKSQHRACSAYSLNPINKYGQKRLCNEIGTKKITKISRLSQESQQLEARIQELKREEEELQLKYQQVKNLKVSRKQRGSVAI